MRHPHTIPDEKVIDVFRETIADQIDASPDDLQPDTRLDDLTDSLGLVEIVLLTEEVFEIDCLDEELDEIATVAQAVAYIQQRLAVARGASHDHGHEDRPGG